MQSSDVDELLPQPVQLDPQADGAAADSTAYTADPADFHCSRPGCENLLLRPLVPVCGHPICRCRSACSTGSCMLDMHSQVE